MTRLPFHVDHSGIEFRNGILVYWPWKWNRDGWFLDINAFGRFWSWRKRNKFWDDYVIASMKAAARDREACKTCHGTGWIDGLGFSGAESVPCPDCNKEI